MQIKSIVLSVCLLFHALLTSISDILKCYTRTSYTEIYLTVSKNH